MTLLEVSSLVLSTFITVDKFMKIKAFAYLASFALLFSIATLPAYAIDWSQPLASNCDAEGPNGCDANDLIEQLKVVFIVFVTLIIGWNMFMIIKSGTLQMFKENQSEALAALKERAWKSLSNIALSLIIVGAMVAFYQTILVEKFSKPFDVFKAFQSFNEPFVVSVYAAEGEHLPSPLVVETVYDLAILSYQFAMRWIFIPLLIASWVWTGFLFIRAQGNPEGLKRARERLTYSIVWTVILMTVLGLAFTLRDTANQILS